MHIFTTTIMGEVKKNKSANPLTPYCLGPSLHQVSYTSCGKEELISSCSRLEVSRLVPGPVSKKPRAAIKVAGAESQTEQCIFYPSLTLVQG